MRTGIRCGGWAGAALFLLMTPFAQADGVLHARVSFEGGEAMIKGQADTDWSYATLNTLVLPGDVLWADTESTVEVEFSGGTFLRMADQSRSEVIGMTPDGIVRGWTGSFYVQRIRRSTGDFVFRTPAADIEVDQDSHVRIDVVENGATTVAVRWGEARVRTPGGRDVVVTRGKRTYIDDGYLPSSPERFELAYMDAFDEWSRQRAELIAVGQDRISNRGSSASTHIGYLDLDHHGDWVTVSGRSYWRPSRVSNYVPYREGYWSYVPEYGHVWCGSYSFSYYTSHYGRWTYNDRYGWLWTYRDGWGPAWVAAARYGDYYVWSPLDYYNRPVTHSHTRFSVGGITFDIHSTNYVHSDYLYAGYHHIYRCPTDFTRRYSHRGTNYAWNIYSPRFNEFPSRYGGYGAPVTLAASSALRDYSPRRVIRGYDYVSDGAPRAATRASALESNVSRVQFSGRTSTRGVRTAFTESSRTARVRTAAITQGNRTMSNSIARRREVTMSAPSASAAPTGGSATDSSRSVRSAAPGVTSTRSSEPATRTTRSLSPGTATRTTSVAPRSSTPRATTPRTSTSRETSTRSTTRATTPTPQERTSRPSVTSIPQPTNRMTTRTTVPPSNRSVTQSAPTSPRRSVGTSTRTTPRVSTPSPRVSAPSSRTTAPAPRVSTPRMTAPSVSAPRVSAPQPQRTAPRVQAPQRVIQQRSAAPQQITAPTQRQSPTIQRVSPPPTAQRSQSVRSPSAPMVNRSAPQSQSSRSVGGTVGVRRSPR